MDNKLKEPFDLFGIECGSGWERLYKPVIEKINQYNLEHPDSPIKIEQIKEKWGHLRIYVSNEPDEIYDMILKAEQESQFTCEECGFQHKTKVTTRATRSGWIRTLCNKCREKYETT
jgi:hypothetical protein